jgi:hypothetical protein
MMATYTEKVSAETETAAIVSGLLEDCPKPVSDLSVCGPFQEAVGELIASYQQGGVQTVRQSFIALSQADSALARLVSTDISSRRRWTVAELLDTDFPEPRWAVPGLIPVGLSILAGRPKVGKSWLGLQLAHAVGSGRRFLDQPVQQGSVLSLALEDPGRRLKDRIEKQGFNHQVRVSFETSWPHFDKEGLNELEKCLKTEDFSLVIVDTLSRALSRADQNEGTEMTHILGSLQGIAQDRDLALILIDHHRKSAQKAFADPIDDIMGSTAKAAVVDAVLGLYQEKGKHEAELRITGRDIEARELALTWDVNLCCWQYRGDADGVRANSIKGEVFQAIRQLQELGELATTTRIAGHLDRDKGNVSRILAELLAAGKISKGKKRGNQQPYRIVE